jgi:16S rRNA processing protein RimM
MSGESSSLIELGVVGAPFGVRGWVKLRSFTDPPDRLLQHRSVQLHVGGSWVAYKIEASGRSGGQLTAKLKGVNDLIGCEVVNLAGRYLGKVRHFVETPAQVLMVVRGGAAAPGEKESPGEQEYWVPAVPLHLRRVDLTARRVLVDWDDAAG